MFGISHTKYSYLIIRLCIDYDWSCAMINLNNQDSVTLLLHYAFRRAFNKAKEMYNRAIIYRTKNMYRVQAHCVDEKGTPPTLPGFTCRWPSLHKDNIIIRQIIMETCHVSHSTRCRICKKQVDIEIPIINPFLNNLLLLNSSLNETTFMKNFVAFLSAREIIMCTYT